MSETYEEKVCRVFPKETVASLKTDSDLFLTAIQNSFYSELSYRLMEVLKSNGEVVVKLSDIRSFDEPCLNEVHYVQNFKWAPLIRCKNCKFYIPMNRETKTGICNLAMHQNFGDDWFCAGADKKGEPNDYLRISGDR